MSKIFKVLYDSSTDCNSYINWGSRINVSSSMSLSVISGQVVTDIDIGSTFLMYRDGAWNLRFLHCHRGNNEWQHSVTLLLKVSLFPSFSD